MRQFGVPIAERLNAVRLPGVIEGGSLGNTFFKGLQRGFDYLKNGGTNNPDATTGGGTGGPSVEKASVDVAMGQP